MMMVWKVEDQEGNSPYMVPSPPLASNMSYSNDYIWEEANNDIIVDLVTTLDKMMLSNIEYVDKPHLHYYY